MSIPLSTMAPDMDIWNWFTMHTLLWSAESIAALQDVIVSAEENAILLSHGLCLESE